LEYHIAIALNVGVHPGEIVETIVHLAPFVGFARALNAARSARRGFASRGAAVFARAPGLAPPHGPLTPPAMSRQDTAPGQAPGPGRPGHLGKMARSLAARVTGALASK